MKRIVTNSRAKGLGGLTRSDGALIASLERAARMENKYNIDTNKENETRNTLTFGTETYACFSLFDSLGIAFGLVLQ